MSIKENIGLSSLKYKLRRTSGLLDLKKEESIAENSLKALKIKARSIDDTAASLSGGNQQKVVLAKVLACDPELLILDEPTIGIDIKSREEIMKLIQNLTTMGLSVIYVTNDFDELLRIADRVVIFNKGRIVGDVQNDGLTPEKVIEIRDNKGGIAI
jgi:simple sugar transport system ATP-binding protein